MNRYETEREQYAALPEYRDIIKTADLIAEGMWFSWIHCKRRLKKLTAPQRARALALLRIAQKQRKYGIDIEQAAIRKIAESKRDPLRSFIVPVQPAAYAAWFQPIMYEGEVAGVTLGGHRIRGNRIIVFYSTRKTYAWELVRIEVKTEPSESLYLAANGCVKRQSIYHVTRKH